jgi:hypothetical protein
LRLIKGDRHVFSLSSFLFLLAPHFITFGITSTKTINYLCALKPKIMKTITKKSTPKAANSKAKTNEAPKKVSKTWQAVLSLRGTGEILDRRAVLK